MLKGFLASKYLPWIAAAMAIIFMLPAIKEGLLTDDLIQRIPQLKPSQIPPNLYRTGAVPENTGTLKAVIFETFGFTRTKQRLEKGINYGMLPWCFTKDTKCSLWRPLTAFTHWLDYRIFPNSPALMHVRNILWFAAGVFFISLMYRKIIGANWIAGLAAIMFVLDSNTYFPVMFVANRGFIAAFFMGVCCFYFHRKWRIENSKIAASLSFVFMMLSLLCNEGGVSTFAFILAYELALDDVKWAKRLTALLPAIACIMIWRIVYNGFGFGVSGIGGGYIDPGYEPFKFLMFLPIYVIAILSGQLSGIAPDIMMGLNFQWCKYVYAFYIAFIMAAMILFLPVIWKNKIARFWFLVFVFAAIPVVAAPASKNFIFLSVGAYGFIAIFVYEISDKQKRLSYKAIYKYASILLCCFLLLVHIPLAAVSRIFVPRAAHFVLSSFSNPRVYRDAGLSQESDFVIINAPCYLATSIVPFTAAYYNLPVPKSVHSLGALYTGLTIERPDERTLIITSKEENIFTANQEYAVHITHAMSIMDRLFVSPRMFKNTKQFVNDDFTVEILEIDSGFAKKAAFTFTTPLENKKWLRFDLDKFGYVPFELPQKGDTVIIEGPGKLNMANAINYVFGKTGK